MPVTNIDALIEDRVTAIRDAHARTGIAKAEVDLSGGIDSAVILALVVRAIGTENVITVHSQINSNPEALERAQLVADACGAKLCVIDLTDLYEGMVARTMDAMQTAGYDMAAAKRRIAADKTVLGSIRSTLRAPVGRGFNRIFGGGLRHGTGNECEDRWLRFYQKGGDGEVDSNPIAMLSKGEVYQLAVGLGLPNAVITARPTPDLWDAGDAHNDEDEIGAYLSLDAKKYGHTFYSYVDPNSGNYTSVGLIERVSRFCDATSDALFQEGGEALAHGASSEYPEYFFGLETSFTESLLIAARRAERVTRHKVNPNCPMYGTRKALLASGILTDTLPIL